jgi:hypothetical protein
MPTINVKTSTVGPQEVPELKLWEHPPYSWPPGGAEAEGLGAPNINVKTSTPGPREVSELKVWDRPPST